MNTQKEIQIGSLARHLRHSGTTDLAVVADAVHQRKLEERNAGRFVYDRYSKHGSENVARVVDHDGEEKECILWTINHYLGLNRHPKVIQAVQEAVARYGTGCGTSAMSVGMNGLHKQLEQKLTDLFPGKAALLYPTGFTANSGVLSTVLHPGDLLLCDRESHASILEGGKTSGAKVLPFRHNDMEDLRGKLLKYQKRYHNVLVAVEAAYSMSGDLAPLKEIAALKEELNFMFYVDEAHSFGFMGEKGRGWTYACGVEEAVDFYVATLSKSAASKGGFVICQDAYRTYLQCNSATYIFQACVSPADTAAALASIELFSADPGHAQKLIENNRYFRGKLIQAGFDLGESQSPIVPVFIPDLDLLYAVSAQLFEQGVYTTPVAYPVVGEREGRLRFIVNASHTQNDMDRTVQALCTAFSVSGIDDLLSYFQEHQKNFPLK